MKRGPRLTGALKRTAPQVICVLLTLAAAAAYFQMRTPDWWNEELQTSEVIVQSHIDKPVYATHKMKRVAFYLKQGDKCFDINNESFSFGVPDAEYMGYTKMLIVCPGKGAGWVENSW